MHWCTAVEWYWRRSTDVRYYLVLPLRADSVITGRNALYLPVLLGYYWANGSVTWYMDRRPFIFARLLSLVLVISYSAKRSTGIDTMIQSEHILCKYSNITNIWSERQRSRSRETMVMTQSTSTSLPSFPTSVEGDSNKRKRILVPTETLNKYQATKKQLASIRKSLPVFPFRKEILSVISENEAVLVVAETVSHWDFLFFMSHLIHRQFRAIPIRYTLQQYWH